MTVPDYGMRPLKWPLTQSQDITVQTPDEPATTFNSLAEWPTADSEERVNIVLNLSLDEYVALASSVWVGADIAYGSAEYVWWVWTRSLVSMSLCDDVAQCITDSDAVFDAIVQRLQQAGIVNNSTIVRPLPLLPTSTAENYLPDDYTCDNLHYCGMARGIVQDTHAGVEEILQGFEGLTDPIEFVSVFVDNVEAVSWFGSVIEFGTWLQDELNEEYDTQWSQTVEDNLTCELFCEISADCEVSVDVILEAYRKVISSANPPTAPSDVFSVWQWLQTITSAGFSSTIFVAAFHWCLWQAIRFGGTMPAAFLGIRSLETIVSVHEDDTDTYCGTNCNCPDTWCFSLPLGDFSTFDFSSVTPGLQEAGSYDGNNWNATDIQLTGGFTNRAVGIEYNLGQTVSAETYEWQGLAQQGFGTLGSGLYVARIQLFNGATNVFDSGTGADPNFSDTSHIWSSSETFDRIRFWQVVSRATGGQVGGAGSTSALILRGNGVNPFGSDNC